MNPYFGGVHNALVGISGPQSINSLQPQMQPQRPPLRPPMSVGMPPSQGFGPAMIGANPGNLAPGVGLSGMPRQPMMQQMPPQQSPWTNPHAGAYQEWMQKNSRRGSQQY